jgi:hypothetical protein
MRAAQAVRLAQAALLVRVATTQLALAQAASPPASSQLKAATPMVSAATR